MPDTNEEKLIAPIEPGTIAAAVAAEVIETTATSVAVEPGVALVEEALAEPAAHAFLLKDLGDAIERVNRSKHLGETKKEFSGELYPLLQAIVDHFGERMEKTEAALVEIIDQTESLVQADLAMLVANALNLGKAMAAIIQQFKPGMTLDAKGVAKMKGLAAQYIAAADEAANAVADVTIEPGEDEDDDEDDEDDAEEEGK